MTYVVDDKRRVTLPAAIKPGSTVHFQAAGADWQLSVLPPPRPARRGVRPARLFPNIEPISAREWRRIYARKDLDRGYDVAAFTAAQAFPAA